MKGFKPTLLSVLVALSIAGGVIADNLTPVLDDISALFTGPMVTFAVAIIVILIIFGLLGFVLGLFDSILDMMKIKGR